MTIKNIFYKITSVFRKNPCYICGGPAIIKQDDGKYLCYDHLRDFDDPDYPEEEE